MPTDKNLFVNSLLNFYIRDFHQAHASLNCKYETDLKSYLNKQMYNIVS